MKKILGQSDYTSNFSLSIGIVKNNADLTQMGRLQVFIPALDSAYNLEDLPWAMYVSPFAGTTANLKVGRSKNVISGVTTYGFWAIPKVGSQVLCGCMEGDPNVRYWLGSLYMTEMNRTMPRSIDGGLTEIDQTDTYPQTKINYENANLTEAGLQNGTKHYKTRGGYERSISYPANKIANKPSTNGYAAKPLQPDAADSQTICLTSPGRHYFVMSDVDEYCRIRLKTTEGSQIIFDDTNERIYISTARGKNWVELDEGNGKMYIYSDSKISIRGKNDINIFSDENINIVAKKRVNIKSETRSVNIESVLDVRLLSTQADVMLTASRDIQLKTTNGAKASPISEKTQCVNGIGLIYDWPEKGGSATSSIKLDSSNNIECTAQKGINLASKTNINIKSLNGSLNLQAKTINNSASGAINFTSGSIGLVANDGEEGSLSISPLNNAENAIVASSADSVSSSNVVNHMIVPDHEPWVRDNDETKCKTKRNPSYQG